MRRVFKPENIVKNQKSIIIPDIEFKEESPFTMNENGEPVVLTEELYQKIRNQLREEMSGELGRQKLSAIHERDMILGKAKKDAQKLLDDATVTRRSILDEANASAEQLKREAYEEGLKKGITDKSEILEDLARHISQNIEQLKHDENEYFEEYEKQLKYVASEIAEKIIYQKINEDDMSMYNLVKNAIKTVRDASWIKAEVSEKLSGYIDSLEKELADSGIKSEIIINDNVPEDSCVLNTSDGFIVASASQQIANLKEFISRRDKGGNDE